MICLQLILSISILISNSQFNSMKNIYIQKEFADSSKVYTVVDQMPRFPGCETSENIKPCADKKMLSYLFKHLRINPVNEDENLDYTIVVSFIIEKDGDISHISILKGEKTVNNSNLRKVLENMPKWIPGQLNGQIVRVKLNLPIRLHY